jgi:hypothetical protein
MIGSKKQHYVPQLYLRSFTSGTGQISVFDKATRRSYASSVRDAGHENHFLSIPELDGSAGPGSHFEALFQEVEAPAAIALANVVSAAEEHRLMFLDQGEREILARFLAVQFLRTPEARTRVIEALECLTRSIMSIKARQNAMEWDHKTISEAARIPVEKYARVHAQFGLNPEQIATIAYALDSHVWRVMINCSDHPFYTSDNPLAFHCHVPRPGRGVGIATYGVEVAFPLSPRLMLTLVHRGYARDVAPNWLESEGMVGEGNDGNVEYYRWMQIVSARRFLFAPRDDFTLAREVCEQEPDLCDMDRKRMEVWWGGQEL